MQPVLVHFEKSTLAQLETVCSRTLISRAAFIRRAVENALDPKTGIEAQLIIAAELAATEAYNQAIADGQSKP